MADTVITLTIKNADNAELLAAGRLFYGQIQDGEESRDRTAPEVVEAFKTDVLRKLRWIVREYRNSQRDPIEEPTLGE